MEQIDSAKWICKWRLEKRQGEWNGQQIDAGIAPVPFEVREGEGNLLMYGGVSILWEALIGAVPTAFSNANAHIGVGDSSTAVAATQTDLQAATNKVRVAMDSTYPQHTDGVDGSDHAQVVFRMTAGSAVGNFAWAEWAVFNASTSGRMLNRKVEALGTKASGSSWTLTVTLSLA